MITIDQDTWVSFGLDQDAWNLGRYASSVFIDRKVYRVETHGFSHARVTCIRYEIFSSSRTAAIGSFKTRDEAENVVAKLVLYGVQYRGSISWK